MRPGGLSVRLILLALLAVAVSPPSAAQAQLASADVNGDGLRDRVERGRDRTELIVKISNDHIQRLHTQRQIFRVVLADVDHDGDADLVASTAPAGLRIWLNRGKGRFVRARSNGPKRRSTFGALGDRVSRSGPEIATSTDRQESSRPGIVQASSILAPAVTRLGFFDTALPRSRLDVRPLEARGPPPLRSL